MIAGRSARRRRRRAAILLELLIAIALFAGAALFTWRTVSQAIDSFERGALEQQGLDRARSIMARLDAGLLSIEQVRDGEADDLAGDDAPAGNVVDDDADVIWRVEIDTSPTEHEGLSLVELELLAERSATGSPDDVAMRVVQSQLIATAPMTDEPDPEDDLVRDLPGAEDPES